MALQLKKNGADISSTVDWTTLQLTLVLTKEVSKCQFDIVAPVGSAPSAGDQIDFYEAGSHIFGGILTARQLIVDGGLALRYKCTAVDWSYNLDKILVAKTYTNEDPATIVNDIITNYTTGFTTTHVVTGNFLVPSIKFNYLEVTKAIQKLATLIGWDWYVDADKDVHFFLAETVAAPFNVDDTSGNLEWPTLDVDIDLSNMKNSVFVIGGNYSKTYSAGNTPDVYTTDGTKLIYPVAYSYKKATLTVTLAGVSQTIGVDQQDNPASFNVLYNAGQNGVGAFLRFPTAPTASQTLKVYGDASIPILAHATDQVGIATYGEHQSSIVDKQITTVAEAQQRAKAEIIQYGHAVYTVKFNTLKTGLRVGQTITLNSPILGVNVPLTIKRLTGSGYAPGVLEWAVEAYGSDAPSFVDIMSMLLQQENQQNPVADSTVLEVLVSANESIAITDTSTITGTARPYKWGPTNPQTRWGFATWA